MTINAISRKYVTVCGGLLENRQKIISEVTLDHIFNKYEQKGRLGAATWSEGKPNKPHFFYDSDVAKLIEAVAYSLSIFPDTELKARTDKVINDLLAIQEPDGYLNSYFHNVAPEEKWADIRIKHELYCAGHLIEAGIAWFQKTGDHKLLNAMCKYADLISEKFGNQDGQINTWPGHQEIELALFRLYKETGEKKYLESMTFFIKERGKNIAYWYDEAEKLGVPSAEVEKSIPVFQAHLPVQEQGTAEGHAVRACYFYSGMADLAREKNDAELFAACQKIWRNIVDKRMNITGGIGSDWLEERFTYDYDLPEEYYYETCAQISLFFFAQRMFLNEQKSEYGDIMELTLYNSILSGIDVEGRSFFYSNPLVNFRQDYKFDKNNHHNWGMSVRQSDFSCSCCPPNISRLIMSIGQYIYAVTDDAVWINLFIDSEAELEIGDSKLSVRMKTDYPFKENIVIDIATETIVHCKFKIRIPCWCRNPDFRINNNSSEFVMENGFAVIDRDWQNGDSVKIKLPMPVEIIEAHPAVRQAVGKVAIKRGPIVYCLEEKDNIHNVFDIALLPDSEFAVAEEDIASCKVPVIKFNATHRITDADNRLYSPIQNNHKTITAQAIPYFMWANRGENEMTVWILRAKD